ncbi:MAG: DUF5074 domain-containing protein [Rikenellaceae bacterium]
MKRIYSALFCAAALFSVVSCEQTNNEDENPDSTGVEFIYTLNSGSYQANNASLSSYAVEDGVIVDDLFASVNGQGLGDTAQDMVVFDDKIFITVYGSGVIFVTDFEGQIIEQITDETYFSPRYLATDENYVYVSYYDGAVAKLDPDTYALTITAVEAAGNPEELDVVNGKLYVAVADYGYGNEQSVVSLFETSTMSFVENIAVVANPTTLTADTKGNVYVISMGDYYLIPQSLQRIDTDGEITTLSVSGISGAATTAIAIGKDDILYVVEGVSDASTGYKMQGSVYAYNPTTNSASEFISDGTTIADLYSISCNTQSGEVYVGTSDYYNTGDVYVLNSEGVVETSFGVGVNPMKSICITIEE